MAIVDNSEPVTVSPSVAVLDTRVSIPGRNGHGTITPGGKPGNRGGKGTTPSAVRKACRKSFAARMPLLRALADDPNLDVKDRLRAIEMFGRFGLSGAVTWDDIRGRLKLQLEVLRRVVPEAELEGLLAELSQIWR